MPHLRRQPNPHDLLATQGSSAQGSLRAQFQTPPARHTPSNPTHHHPPSTDPNEIITPEAVPVMAPPSGYPNNPFAIFGRSQPVQPPPEDEYGLEDDYDPNVQDMEPVEYDDEMGADGQYTFNDGVEDSDEVEGEEIEDHIDDGDEEMLDREKSPSPIPPNLREISSLASWTVSTSKPGSGVAALRNPSPTQYWQSDGPQPHTLTLHFFKLVAIVRIRVHLDFELDESYTPTKMVFLAGMGGNDLVEFATWEGEAPCGWVDVPLEGVGGRNGGWVRDETSRRKRHSKTGPRVSAGGDEDSDAWMTANEHGIDGQNDEQDPYNGSVLKAMVLQMRVMENHQNGKDTHVRGFQVFACDDTRRVTTAPSASADRRDRQRRRYSARHSLHGPSYGEFGGEDRDPSRLVETTGLGEPEWMGEPVIR